MLVVRRLEILSGRHQLARVPSHVDVPLAEQSGRDVHREDAALPSVMEDRLVRLGIDPAETLPAAPVVPALHDRGLSLLGVPLIASLLTSAASSASDTRSEPGGPSG